MNTESMLENLVQARARLKAIDIEREALTTFIDGTERVLSLSDARFEEVPTTSIRDAIRTILKEADGKVVSSDEIARRIGDMNVATTAKNLAKSVDSSLFQMVENGEPFERESSKRWRWVENHPRLLAEPDVPATGNRDGGE